MRMAAIVINGYWYLRSHVRTVFCSQSAYQVQHIVVVLTLTRIIKSVVTGQASITGVEGYPMAKCYHTPINTGYLLRVWQRNSFANTDVTPFFITPRSVCYPGDELYQIPI